MDLDTAFLILRVFAGLVVAAHGAQKALGWFGGQGLLGWHSGVEKMGFRPVGFWAHMAAWGELAGGLCLAVGLFTGLVAGVLVMDMIVAIWKAHWAKGFFVQNGGYEYPLTLLVIFGLMGLAGPGAYSADAPLRLVSWTMTLFLVTLVVGLTAMWASTRPAAVARVEEERRRRAA